MDTAVNLLVVGLGGGIGAMLRYGLSALAHAYVPTTFPLATVTINVTGSFVLGLVMTLAAARMPIDPRVQLFVATGVLGGYTTFSTFEYETLRLAETASPWLAALNVLVSVGVGFAAVMLGARLAR